MLTPISLLIALFLGLVAIAIPVFGALLLRFAFRRPKHIVPAEPIQKSADAARNRQPERSVDRAERSVHRPARVRLVPWREHLGKPSVLTALVIGVFLLLLPLGLGRALVQHSFRAAADEPQALAGAVKDLKRPDGTKIHVEVFGADDAPQLVLTHGWSMTSTEWYYAKKQLAGRFRVIVWDLPGLGKTEQPKDDSDSLEQMAADLDQVLSVAQGEPVVLVGHSIGGMTNLTFAKLHPERFGSQVKGIVQVDTTYTNPVKTTSNSRLNLALQKPVGEPLLHLMIAFSPLVRFASWISYREGILNFKNAKSSFAGTESRGQVDLVSRLQVQASPAVVARGTLAMFHWDASTTLPQISVPVLIVVGAEDTTTIPGASATMQRSIPVAKMQLIDPSRHYALLERNEAVDVAIAQFAEIVLR
jgi:pimeloyl-ACP methyl ester carboxylesterase